MAYMDLAHLNVARLRQLPGDPRAAEFVENVPKVHALAVRSLGFVWLLDEGSARANPYREYQALWGDPLLAVTLSVWENCETLMHFVGKTVHGAFLRRRAEWFEPFDGPNYVLWHIPVGRIPTIDEAKGRLDSLHPHGPGPEAFDFAWHCAKQAGGMPPVSNPPAG